MAKRLTVLIVNDSRAAREELSTLLFGEPHIHLVGMARHGLEALTQAGRHRPDLVLIDQDLPGLPGLEVARRLKEALPETKVLVLGADAEDRQDAGVEARFIRREDTIGLLQAIKEIHSPPIKKKRPLRLPKVKKERPKIVPWLSGAIRILGVALLIGIVLSRGTLLAYIALLSGVIFFVYAMKYYLSMGMIMLASGGAGNGANGHLNGNGFKNGNGHKNGNGGKIAKRLNGLRNGNGDNGNGHNGLKNGNGNGNGNGAKERLKKQPFVSVQLPMFNEDSVVDRLLEAATSLDYDNYEILVADDSSDTTVNRLEKWARHPKVKVSHRINRSGFKGAALHYGLEIIDPRTEFIAIFDADFVPPPQIIWQFLDYFYGYKENGNGNGKGNGKGNGNGHGNGNGNGNGVPGLVDESIGVVQGYQWHMLNADENWITKGVRAEYSGSYVIERSGQELLGGMKMISGSVYMIRADVLRQVGWGTSITEDWELTLKLYLNGFKVLYTPFIQAPSECVSTFGRLVRQRMRWAEGHTYNVRKYFMQILTSPKVSRREKLEFIYYAPYYLQSIFFTIGTVAWFFSETILHHEIPFWTSLLGWSLVFSNMGALVLMNLSGLFMERGVKKEWTGVLSAVLYGTLLVPFQGYAALKGLLEVEEGGWFRTPKTGTVTKVIDKLSLGGKMGWLQPKKRKPSRLAASKLVQATGVAILLSQPGRFLNTLIGIMTVGILALSSLSPFVTVAGAAPDSFYLHDVTAGIALQEVEDGGSTGSTTVATTNPLTAAHDQLYLAAIVTNANVAVSSVAGLGLTWTVVAAQCSVSAETRVEVWEALGTTTGDEAVTATLASAPNNAAISVSRFSGVDTANPIGVITAANGKGSFGSCGNGASHSSYSVSFITSADNSWAYGAVAIQDKTHTPGAGHTERTDFRVGSGNEAGLATEDKLEPTASTSVTVDGTFSAKTKWAVVAVEIQALSISPSGRAMNTTVGSAGSTLTFDTVGQNEYWYAEETWPLHDDNGSIAAGAYNLNMYLSQLPSTTGPPGVDTVSTGDTRPASLTISHTTGSGSDRLMLVGISFVNDELETVSSVTYNGVSLGSPVGTIAEGDDARVEIYSMVAPPTGTYDVVITFSAPLRRSAVAGVMTFTGVHQTTPLGSFFSDTGVPPSAGPTVDVTSATNELVFDTVACENCTSLTVGASQTERWNINEPSGSPPSLGAGSTEPGAGTVTMSWTQGSDDYWAIGAVPIKPSGGSAPAVDGSASSGSTQRTGITISHTTSGTERLMLVGVSMNNNQSETVSTVTYNGASFTSVGTATEGNDTRVEIWRLLAPATGTHDVVITFSASLRYSAKAGAITFTNVDQTTPLGTFVPANGNSAGPATVDVSSATNELVFDTASCEGCSFMTAGAGQTIQWNLNTLDSGSVSEQTLSRASTEPGAGTVTMDWNLGATAPWAIGAVPIKPGTTSPSVDIVVSVHHTASNGSGETLIVQSPTTTIDSNTTPTDPYVLSIDTGALQTFTSSNPRRLRLRINVTSINAAGSFVLAYDGTCGSNQCSNLATPAVVVPEYGWVILPLAAVLPPLILWKRRKRWRKGLEEPNHG